jgi:hypothetical protein
VVQSYVPAWQSFVLGVQAPSCTHAVQLALLSHTLPVSHAVPAVRFAPATQFGPALQDNAPLLQALVGEQVSPSLQATHAPVLHTLSVPQPVPSAVLPLAVHTGPAEQDRLPVAQTLFGSGWQTSFTLQATQVPALHTWSVPQPVPSLAAVPVSIQMGLPLAQLSVPTLQGAASGAQLAPSTQVAPESEPPSVPSPLAPASPPLSAPASTASFKAPVAVTSAGSAHTPPFAQTWPVMQSRSAWHWSRHWRSTAHTSGSWQSLLKLHCVSTGSWQTLFIVLSVMQRSPAGQSVVALHSAWQRPKLHTKSLLQSLLSVQGLVVKTAFEPPPPPQLGSATRLTPKSKQAMVF